MAEIKRRWLERIGDVEVERITDVKRSGVTSDLSVPAKGVLHTTEGGWEGSLSVFRNVTGTPTIMGGRDITSGRLRAAQFMPIGEMALTLKNAAGGTETNREARVQIECLGFSQFGGSKRWFLGVDRKSLDEEAKNFFADLVYQASEAAGIPHRHAGIGFGNRSVGQWDSTAGWYAHSEAPENDHSDPGNEFAWEDLFARGQRWEFRLVTKDGVQDRSPTVRGHVLKSEFAKFIARKATAFARHSVLGHRPRFVRHRIR